MNCGGSTFCGDLRLLSTIFGIGFSMEKKFSEISHVPELRGSFTKIGRFENDGKENHSQKIGFL